MSLGRKLRQHRKAAGLTLQEVAKETGVSFTHLSEIERGASQPSVRVLRILAQFYRIAITIEPGKEDQVTQIS